MLAVFFVAVNDCFSKYSLLYLFSSLIQGENERVCKMENEKTKTAVLDAIRQRRSTRAYNKDPVPEEIINEIVEAGRYAPSAGNGQHTHFYVITNAEKLAELRGIVTSVLANTQEQEGMSSAFLNLIKRAKEGEVDVIYGAPVLIVTTNKKGGQNAIADCSCALQNMMLAASVNQVANVWINQFFMLQEAPPIRNFFAGIGVTEDEELFGSLALGFTEKLETTPLPRTGNPITYIR